ncbi:tripartite tricarboxylate transporter substrate-binding protein [Sulfitobacter sp. LCG007]
MGGHVTALITPTAGVIQQHEAGQQKILAVLSDERLPMAPDLPTAKEQRLDVSMAQSNGFMFPAGTPREPVEGFCDALEAVAADPDFVSQMEALNVNVRFLRGDAFASYMDGLFKQISDLAAQAGYGG